MPIRFAVVLPPLLLLGALACSEEEGKFPEGSLTITEPADGATVSTKEISIRGTAPPGAEIHLNKSLAGDPKFNADGEGRWEYKTELDEGENEFDFFLQEANKVRAKLKVNYAAAAAAEPTEEPDTEETAQSTPEPPAGPATSFGSGTKTVGQDIAPGTYRGNLDGDFCYFARLSGFSGELNDIIANGNTTAPEIVTIAPTDAGFDSERCGDWTQDLSPITTSQTASFEQGTFAVGVDIAAGTWSAPGGESCYWQRMSGFSHTLDNIIANDVGGASPVVTIAEGDIGFNSNGCGTWTRQG